MYTNLQTFLLLACLLLGITAFTPLSDETLSNLPAAGADFDIKNGVILAPILIPRVPGTPGSTLVQTHFAQWFAAHLPNWTVEYQNSTSKTPATGDKQVPFINIIVTRDPPWTKPGEVGRLALVAHYDSKLTPPGFIGATDSAAPCAMIMHAARSVDEALTKKWEAMKAEGSIGLEEEKGVQILFLDGEEAFIQWTDDDSLYGARYELLLIREINPDNSRALAENWEATPHAAMSTYHNMLSSITLFLLLDLLGSQKPRIPSYFKTTHWAYQHLALVESRMRTLGLLKSQVDHPFLPETDKNSGSFRAGGIEDDHLPFMARGVEILHIIPTPFPRVWHTPDDDGEHLDMPTVEDWAKIVTAFVAEWMDLEGYMPTKAQAEARMQDKRSASSRKTELSGPSPHSRLLSLDIQRIKPDAIDYWALRGWLHCCQRHLADACSLTSLKSIPSFRLINCFDRKVIVPSLGVSFVALSYVWGPGPQPAIEMDDEGQLTAVEMVIEDAMRVTLELGFAYLWLDRYCIRPEDNEDLHAQLQNMRLVYQNAEVTIIAAAGSGTFYRLPGVGERSGMPYPYARVGNQILTTIGSPSDLQDSVWASRGWTYHDGLLARRRLIFTQHEVAFECQTIFCQKAVQIPNSMMEEHGQLDSRQKDKLALSHVLHVEAPTGHFRLRESNAPYGGPWQGVIRDGIEIHGEFFTTEDPSKDENFRRRLIEDLWLGIVIKWYKGKRESHIYILIVDESMDPMERVGLLKFTIWSLPDRELETRKIRLG
ncbi:hypothetical protein G7Y89_g8949 [Cudoniella acicularis]|uniref:Peptide hydrolase n=1 Tax=Cudoniella acicularis TaxID=354080 RepID=A0A8H4W0J9_9HELO|nr:hypothetical protein G7Y89_g8949 [Cudoniella acicularis]